MQKLLRGSWWVAGLLLAVGCRSEQAAFSFRPAPGAISVAAAVMATGSPATATPVAPSESAPLATVPPSVAAPTPTSIPSKAPIARPSWRQRSAARFRQPIALRANRLETAARASHRDTLHWVLGGALVVAGVVGGILLGGWLGLGVGAALVLLGYYFVVMGLGGRQAWLEVFQEFFNM